MATDGGAAEDEMNDCSKCCFFRSDAWCYQMLRYVRPDGPVCMRFIGGITSDEVDRLIKNAVDGFSSQYTANPPKDTKKPDTGPTCFSCGKRLYIERRGRDVYCAECGCYIPQIMYNKRFADADKTINPMTIPRPTPMPTVKCRG